MDFEIGSLVTRNSHGNDLIFTITDIIDDVYYLKGLNIRLVADAKKDLGIADEEDSELNESMKDDGIEIDGIKGTISNSGMK